MSENGKKTEDERFEIQTFKARHIAFGYALNQKVFSQLFKLYRQRFLRRRPTTFGFAKIVAQNLWVCLTNDDTVRRAELTSFTSCEP